MSPQPFAKPGSASQLAATGRFWSEFGLRIREARLARKLSVGALADRARVSTAVAYAAEGGQPTSVEAVMRLINALGLRAEIELVDPRRRSRELARPADLVHSAMGEFEAAHLRRLGYQVGVDEPYQHYQFAGRADLVAWDAPGSAFLHIENRTRFPNVQESAGSFNSKRAYLGPTIAIRLGVPRWASETHVIAGLWSSEVLHSLRLRPETFRSLCPDPPDVFANWWAGAPPRAGSSSTLVLLDPLASGRQHAYVGLAEAIAGTRARHRGYSDAARAMGGA